MDRERRNVMSAATTASKAVVSQARSAPTSAPPFTCNSVRDRLAYVTPEGTKMQQREFILGSAGRRLSSRYY